MLLMTSTTKVQRFSQVIRERIDGGLYQPLQPIPPIRQIAEEFNVSPGTANLAIAELRAAGLIESKHGRGNYVRPTTRVSTATR